MSDSRQIEAAAAEWLARRDGAAWSAADEAALQDWLAAAIAHRVAFLRLQAAWEEARRLQALAPGVAPGTVPGRGRWAGWLATQQDEPAETTAGADAATLAALHFSPRTADTARRWQHRAMALLATLTIALGSWLGWQSTGRHHATHTSGIGQIQTLRLRDGSLATLSSDSSLDVRLSRGARALRLLRGEAFFEVAHDSSRPFVVSIDGHRVSALGTRFSVRRDGDTLRVVVTEGRVGLESSPELDVQGDPGMTVLPAGHVAVVDAAGVQVATMTPAEAERLLQWRDGYLSFDGTTLADAVAEFNRFNVRKLELADGAVGTLRIGGNFRWANAEGFVSLLEQGFPVRAERLPGRIVLHASAAP